MQQLLQPDVVVADPAVPQQLAVPVDQRDVVMVIGPVDAAERLREFLGRFKWSSQRLGCEGCCCVEAEGSSIWSGADALDGATSGQ